MIHRLKKIDLTEYSVCITRNDVATSAMTYLVARGSLVVLPGLVPVPPPLVLVVTEGGAKAQLVVLRRENKC